MNLGQGLTNNAYEPAPTSVRAGGIFCKVRDSCVKQRCRMVLTVKQNDFVVEISEGASQTSACRSAYNTQNLAPKTIWEEASRLRRHPKVDARIV